MDKERQQAFLLVAALSISSLFAQFTEEGGLPALRLCIIALFLSYRISLYGIAERAVITILILCFTQLLCLFGTLHAANYYLFWKIFVNLILLELLTSCISARQAGFILKYGVLFAAFNLISILLGWFYEWEWTKINPGEEGGRFGFSGYLGISGNEYSYIILPLLLATVLLRQRLPVNKFQQMALLCVSLLSGLKLLVMGAFLSVVSRVSVRPSLIAYGVMSSVIVAFAVDFYLASNAIDYWLYQRQLYEQSFDFLSSGRISRAQMLIDSSEWPPAFGMATDAFVNFEMDPLTLIYNFGFVAGTIYALLFLVKILPCRLTAPCALYAAVMVIAFTFVGHVVEASVALVFLVSAKKALAEV